VIATVMPPRRVPQLWLTLDRQGPLFGQLYRALRQAIKTGRIPRGARAPSTRTLAADLGISRTTTFAVYDQLLAEGYLVATRGSGTSVPDNLPAAPPPRATPARNERAGPRATRFSAYGQRVAAPELAYPYDDLARVPPARYEFLYGVPEAEAFPRSVWRRLVAHRLERATARSLSYTPPEGTVELRRAIAEYLGRARGMSCTPDEVIITNGAQQALHLLAQVLLDPGDAVLIEEPHHLGARNALLAAGASLLCARVDEEGLDLASVPPRALERCRLAYATPSHQFPTGAILSLRRRLELLAWASRTGAYVIEDDYDTEFRFAGRPLESLQSLDTAGRVLYIGTLSKVLIHGLRLG
jgi:GntR family transcriptional regulator/MocR family aminotransferase